MLSAEDTRKLEDLSVLVDRFGTSAYQLHKERTEQKRRSDFIEQNEG